MHSALQKVEVMKFLLQEVYLADVHSHTCVNLLQFNSAL